MPTTTINDNVTVKGLDNIQDTIEIKPLEIKPLNLTTKTDFAVTQPIVTDSKNKTDSAAKLDLTVQPLKIENDQKSAIDVKPLAVDACQTLKLAPLPATCIEQPYHHHFGFTLMGVEFWGFNISGQSATHVQSPEPCRFHSVQVTREDHPCRESGPERHSPGHGGGGIRVRVGEPEKKG